MNLHTILLTGGVSYAAAQGRLFIPLVMRQRETTPNDVSALSTTEARRPLTRHRQAPGMTPARRRGNWRNRATPGVRR